AVGLRNEAWINRSVRRIVLVRWRDHRRVDGRDAGFVEVRTKIESIAGCLEPGIGDPGDVGKSHLGLWKRGYQGAVGNPRHAAARRLSVSRSPLVERDEQRPLHRRRVQRIEQLLAGSASSWIADAVHMA